MQHFYRNSFLFIGLLSLSFSALAVDKSTTIDTDGDGIVNACDADSDNDGIPDVWEDLNNNGRYEDDDVDGDALCIATLGDGVSSYLDLDSENDGVLDLYESGISLSFINLYDSDRNGVLSGPVGVNGFLDALETFPDSGIPIYTARNTDSDDKLNFVDLKSNGPDYDLYTVVPDLSNLDQLGCGFITPIDDPDKDGILTVIDTDPSARGSANSPLTVDYTMTPALTNVNMSCALPVRLIRFSGAEREQAIQLQWEVADARNFSHFEVQRSTDLNHFELIGRVAFAEGESFYQLLDKHPLSAIRYYRLKMVDQDATFTYSKSIAISLTGLSLSWQVSPNPTSGTIKLQGVETGSRIELMNIQGKQAILLGIATESTPSYELGEKPTGVYLLRITSPAGRTTTKRIVLQR